MSNIRHWQGFTLIELSIVLVIIGLLVGGVLIGENLIAAAALRGTISQVEKYNIATYTFRGKYGSLPGDMPPDKANSFGLLMLQSGGNQGNGDNNGVIEDGGGGGSTCSGVPNGNMFAGEIMTFWRHLSDANMVEGQFGSIGFAAIDTANCVNAGNPGPGTDIGLYIPKAKYGRGNGITVISGSGFNYFAILPIVGVSADFLGVYDMGTTGFTPIEARSIDSKLDDGRPETGIVLALGFGAPTAPGGISPASHIGGATPSAAGGATANTCVTGTGAAISDLYNGDIDAGGEDHSCGLAIRFQ